MLYVHSGHLGHVTHWLLGCFGLTAIETVFQSLSGCLPEREKEKRNDRREFKCPNTPSRTYCKRSDPCPTVCYPSK